MFVAAGGPARVRTQTLPRRKKTGWVRGAVGVGSDSSHEARRLAGFAANCFSVSAPWSD